MGTLRDTTTKPIEKAKTKVNIVTKKKTKEPKLGTWLVSFTHKVRPCFYVDLCRCKDATDLKVLDNTTKKCDVKENGFFCVMKSSKRRFLRSEHETRNMCFVFSQNAICRGREKVNPESETGHPSPFFLETKKNEVTTVKRQLNTVLFTLLFYQSLFCCK